MPKKARELSAVQVRALTAPGHHSVGGVAGLALQVTQSGARSWILRAAVGNRRRDIGLGGYPDVTLAQARTKAREARDQIARGIDPIAEKAALRGVLVAQQAKTLTFKQAARHVIAKQQAEAGNSKHGRQWDSTLETYAYPVLGNLPASAIELSHVLAVLEPIWETKTVTATRVRQRIEAVLAWATVHGHRSGDNPARWAGCLDAVLPAPSKITKKRHHRAMPIDAMPEFWARLRERSDMPALALAFTILTGARSGEVLGARWEEIDLASATWIVPPERMKRRREHRVPLAPAAVELLRSLPQAEAGLVFTRGQGRRLSDRAMSDLLAAMGEQERATVHGFRSSLRDWMAERTATPHDVAESVLAHVIGNQAEAAYRRGDLLAKRSRVMRQWADFLATMPAQGGENVTPIRNQAAAE